MTYEAKPGITTTFGPITISGNEKIRTEHIEKTLPMQTGDAYRYATLSVAQRRLFEMQTFSLVTISPDLSDPTRKGAYRGSRGGGSASPGSSRLRN